LAQTLKNSKAVYAALAKFGAPIEGLSAKDFTEPDNSFRMGTPPVMVDIMPKISGVELEEAWIRRVDVRIDDDLSVPFISREDLLVAKLSEGRAQDLIDVDALRESCPFLPRSNRRGLRLNTTPGTQPAMLRQQANWRMQLMTRTENQLRVPVPARAMLRPMPC
jgi:hypothetical protein